MVLRSIRAENLTVDFHISQNIVNELMKNCSSVKQLFLNYAPRSPPMKLNTNQIIHNFSESKPKLEVLKMNDISISDDGFEVLSSSCHTLQTIGLERTNCIGLDKLLMKSSVLRELDIYDADILNMNEILETLGLSCPLLQSCIINVFASQPDEFITLTDLALETFTKGCRNLESLEFQFVVMEYDIDKLFRCLGSYNSLLQDLNIHNCISLTRNEQHRQHQLEQHRQQSIIEDKLQYLSNGCRFLRSVTLDHLCLSSSDISYLVNHSIHLETLFLIMCNICGDGLEITKEADKLKYLKQLNLFFNNYITDESIINVIKGCHNLEIIEISSCNQLTDISLFGIASNCPNLVRITLDLKDTHFTDVGLRELLSKCPKLIQLLKFFTAEDEIPLLSFDIKKEFLRRNLLTQYMHQGLTLSESKITIESEMSSISEVKLNSNLLNFQKHYYHLK